jgi:hypothetical protein
MVTSLPRNCCSHFVGISGHHLRALRAMAYQLTLNPMLLLFCASTFLKLSRLAYFPVHLLLFLLL